MPIDILTTGFVATDSGSIASANAVLLERLVHRENRITFFSKPSFVDPRKLFIDHRNASLFQFAECTNSFADGLRRLVSPTGRGLWGRLWGSVDAASYNRILVRRMRGTAKGDLDLWLGDWAHGRGRRPVVSFVQGCPGTDARSIVKHRDLIARLAGRTKLMQLRAYTSYRLRWGLPSFASSDHVIVGSQWSRSSLQVHYGLDPAITHAIPYPIDLRSFSPVGPKHVTSGPLKLLWLGRFVPRKRLDLMLDGMNLAIRQGCDVRASIIGQSGFVPNYERLIEEFEFPDRIEHRSSVHRTKVPNLLHESDVMCQPSDDEDFGSSVAEGLACGIPAIIGATNGTGDYICQRSIRLVDDHPETMAAAIVAMADAKKRGELMDTEPSRSTAEKFFDPERVTDQLEAILKLAVDSSQSRAGSLPLVAGF